MTKNKESEKLVDEKFIVKFQNELYDISGFMMKHPGGLNTLKGYKQRSIDDKFQSIEHSSSARYLLNGFKINKSKLESNNNELDESMEVRFVWKTKLSDVIFVPKAVISFIAALNWLGFSFALPNF